MTDFETAMKFYKKAREYAKKSFASKSIMDRERNWKKYRLCTAIAERHEEKHIKEHW